MVGVKRFVVDGGDDKKNPPGRSQTCKRGPRPVHTALPLQQSRPQWFFIFPDHKVLPMAHSPGKDVQCLLYFSELEGNLVPTISAPGRIL